MVVQLAFDFTRPVKRRELVAATPWRDRPSTGTEPMPAPSPLWVLPAPALGAQEVAALRREIRPGWQQSAGCRASSEPDAWFPDLDSSEEDTAAARATCVRCPVRRSCLAEAILGDEDGLWGGITRRQRRTALDTHDPEHPDWAGLLDGLLLRLTPAPVPATAVPVAAARIAGGNAA